MNAADPGIVLQFDLATALASLLSLVAGAVAALVGLWFRRTWMPLIAVRLEAIGSTAAPDVIRIVLEAENLSLGKVNKRNAKLRIEPRLFPEPGQYSADVDQPNVEPFAVMGTTKKLEPKEVVHTEMLYRWGDVPSIRCVFTVVYYSRLNWLYCRRQDQHSVAKWIIRGDCVGPSSGREAAEQVAEPDEQHKA